MDDESGESMKPMEEVPLEGLGESELERLVRGWRREAGSWFQRRGQAYWKERMQMFPSYAFPFLSLSNFPFPFCSKPVLVTVSTVDYLVPFVQSSPIRNTSLRWSSTKSMPLTCIWRVWGSQTDYAWLRLCARGRVLFYGTGLIRGVMRLYGRDWSVVVLTNDGKPDRTVAIYSSSTNETCTLD